jgi:hypothetical protein
MTGRGSQKTVVIFTNSVLPWLEGWPKAAVPRWYATWTLPNGGW